MFRQLAPVTALASAVVLALVPMTADAEPAVMLEVTIDGKKYEAAEGQKIEVPVGDRTIALAVTVKPTRRFSGAGVTFDFPRDMSYEFDPGEGVDMWTLDGTDSMIMVQQFDAGDPGDLAQTVLRDILADDDGKLAAEPKPFQMQLGKTKFPAWRGECDTEDIGQSWIACGVEADGQPVLLLVQDMLDDDGTTTAELAGILELLAMTFERD